ncbi:hypothetical protein BDA99DRAFT_33382 [Phascolomyces articulosus]|uniref:Nitrogen regulatory protein areA GATA-like domain-containing protein n=1 Tax=Phascolomyces articulosus TaxID=60185 RepID=A0AAD5KCY3_9FUNG|nr:hypothetical protein BDA99DRAFT_33382 [Phascolomyces articulosus]
MSSPSNTTTNLTSSTAQSKKSQKNIQSVADKLLSESLFSPKKTTTRRQRRRNKKQEDQKKEQQEDVAIDDDDEDDEDTESTHSDDSQKKDPLATKVWRMYTKAKDTLPNGARMENLTWRMMAMTLKQKNAEAEKAATDAVVQAQVQAQVQATQTHTEESSYHEDNDMYDEGEAMAIDHDEDDIDDSAHNNHNEYHQYHGYVPTAAITIEHQRTSPPPADDTTALLSSSAPPYMMDFLRENLELPPEPRNVMVSGSTRASSSTEDIHHCTPAKRRAEYSPRLSAAEQPHHMGTNTSSGGYVFTADAMVEAPMSSPYGSRELSQSVPSLNPSFPFTQHPNHHNRTVIGNPLYQSLTTTTPIPGPSLSAQTALLHHQQQIDPYRKSPPANASPPFYFADMTSPSSTVSTPTTENPTPVSSLSLQQHHPPTNHSTPPSFNPGSLSFEDLLSIYYPDQSPSTQQQQQSNRQQRGSSPLSTTTQQSDPYDSTGLLDLQSMHLTSGNAPPSSSIDEYPEPATTTTAGGSSDITTTTTPTTIAQGSAPAEKSNSTFTSNNNNNNTQSSTTPPTGGSMLHQQKMTQNKTKCTNCGTTTT